MFFSADGPLVLRYHFRDFPHRILQETTLKSLLQFLLLSQVALLTRF